MNLPDGSVGVCKHCGRAMGGSDTYQELGLAEHVGKGQCRACKNRGGPPPDTLRPPTPEWMPKAPCWNADNPDLWYPEPGDRTSGRIAKRICQQECRYKAPCLTWAVKYKEPGIWGGLTKTEREGLSLPVLMGEAA